MDRFNPTVKGPARAAVRLAEAVTRTHVEKQCRNLPIWDGGLGAVVEEVVREAGIPEEPCSAVQVARLLGILPAKARRR